MTVFRDITGGASGWMHFVFIYFFLLCNFRPIQKTRIHVMNYYITSIGWVHLPTYYIYVYRSLRFICTRINIDILQWGLPKECVRYFFRLIGVKLFQKFDGITPKFEGIRAHFSFRKTTRNVSFCLSTFIHISFNGVVNCILVYFMNLNYIYSSLRIK